MYSFKPGNREDALYIAVRARQADVDELWAAARTSPFVSLLRGIQNSPECWTGSIDGEPVCMFGVAAQSILTGYGVPWMVGTSAIDRHSKAFLKGSKFVVEGMLHKWSHLENWVDARNVRAIRWLKYLGFTVHPPLPYGELGLPFHCFEMERSHV